MKILSRGKSLSALTVILSSSTIESHLPGIHGSGKVGDNIAETEQKDRFSPIDPTNKPRTLMDEKELLEHEKKVRNRGPDSEEKDVDQGKPG